MNPKGYCTSCHLKIDDRGCNRKNLENKINLTELSSMTNNIVMFIEMSQNLQTGLSEKTKVAEVANAKTS